MRCWSINFRSCQVQVADPDENLQILSECATAQGLKTLETLLFEIFMQQLSGRMCRFGALRSETFARLLVLLVRFLVFFLLPFLLIFFSSFPFWSLSLSTKPKALKPTIRFSHYIQNEILETISFVIRGSRFAMLHLSRENYLNTWL